MSRGRHRSFLQKHIGTAVAVVLVLLAALAYFGFETMERRAQERRTHVALEQHWPPVRLELQRALLTFDRRNTSEAVDMEEIEDLVRARNAFQQLQRQFPHVPFYEATPLLEDIQERRKRYLPGLLWGQSLASEQVAQELLSHSQSNPAFLPQALEALRKALNAQERIHQEFPDHVHTSYPRSAKLRAHIHEIEAQPLQFEMEAQLEHSGRAAQNSQWELAREHVAQAMDLQQRINEQFPGAPQADFANLLRIESRLTEIEAAILNQEMQSALRSAEIALQAEREALALEHFSHALEKQRDIQHRYPQSEFASAQAADTIAVRIQLLQARNPLEALGSLEAELDLLLAERLYDHLSHKLAQIRRNAERVIELHPLHPDLPIPLLAKVTYLIEIQDRLPVILEELQPLLGERLQGVEILSPWISQALYTHVMGVNPSRVPELSAPVDSVSHEEALQFCERLHFITTHAVSLPSLTAVRDARDSEQGAEKARILRWEWIQALPDSGSAQPQVWDHETQAALKREPHYRSRGLGFRVQMRTMDLPHIP